MRSTNLDDHHSEELNSLNIVSDSNQNIGDMCNTAAAVKKKSENQTNLPSKIIENPEMCAMFDNKMWDGFKIILDKCILNEREIDFTKLDMPVYSVDKHPLMLIARSGQESLLKHDAVSVLLDLKWKLLPRFAFYFNVFFYVIFLILMSIYSVELANVGMEFYNDYKSLLNDLDNNSLSNETLSDEKDIFNLVYYSPNTLLMTSIIIIIVFNIMKEMFQLILVDGLSYFVSMQNLIELLTYFFSLASIFSNNYANKSAHSSMAILFAFLVFPLYIQKVKIFGVYVVSFIRTLKNSAKFFPIFLIIYIGFFLSFKIRSNFGVEYFDSTLFSLLRTLTMVSGELDTTKMGLSDEHASISNYVLYFLFIILMCTILINLFVGKFNEK